MHRWQPIQSERRPKIAGQFHAPTVGMEADESTIPLIFGSGECLAMPFHLGETDVVWQHLPFGKTKQRNKRVGNFN